MFKPVLAAPITRSTRPYYQGLPIKRDLAFSQKFQQGKNVIHNHDGPHSMLLNPRQCRHFRLNAMGQEVWHSMQAPRTIDELTSSLSYQEHEDRQLLRQGVINLCQELLFQGFIESVES